MRHCHHQLHVGMERGQNEGRPDLHIVLEFEQIVPQSWLEWVGEDLDLLPVELQEEGISPNLHIEDRICHLHQSRLASSIDARLDPDHRLDDGKEAWDSIDRLGMDWVRWLEWWEMNHIDVASGCRQLLLQKALVLIVHRWLHSWVFLLIPLSQIVCRFSKPGDGVRRPPC